MLKIITTLFTLSMLIILLPTSFADDIIYVEPNPYEVSLWPGESNIKEFTFYNKGNETWYCDLRFLIPSCGGAYGYFLYEGETYPYHSIEVPANGSSTFKVKLTGRTLFKIGGTTDFYIDYPGENYSAENIHIIVNTWPEPICLSIIIILFLVIIVLIIYYKKRKKTQGHSNFQQPMQQQVRYCPNCGTPIDMNRGYKFCPKCGKNL